MEWLNTNVIIKRIEVIQLMILSITLGFLVGGLIFI